jgi:hypothetical protein
MFLELILCYADVLVLIVLELEHCHNYSVINALKTWNNLKVPDFCNTYFLEYNIKNKIRFP